MQKALAIQEVTTMLSLGRGGSGSVLARPDRGTAQHLLSAAHGGARRRGRRRRGRRRQGLSPNRARRGSGGMRRARYGVRPIGAAASSLGGGATPPPAASERASGAVSASDRTKPTVTVDVKPKFPLAQDLLDDKVDADLAPSTLFDAHIIKVALATLEWSRETLRSRATGVRSADLDNLLRGRSSGFVRSQVFEVLTQAGCDPVEIGRDDHSSEGKCGESKGSGNL
jgi:hypothetical protein